MKINPRSNQWQQLPESAIRRLQAEQLHGYLRSAVLPFSAYYKNLFRERGLTAESIRSLEDLPRLPFITK